MSEREKKLHAVAKQILELGDSELVRYRRENNNLPVCGAGNSTARIMLVGEAPGRNEAKTGLPFCGAAGKILDELLVSVRLNRDQVYITSLIKDRPPQNRDPRPEEIALYAPFLDRQIEIVKPQVIATLGRYSMRYIMERFGLKAELEPINKAHGKTLIAQASYGKVKIIPLYHPAAAIYNQSLKSTLKGDFKVLAQYK